jgi:hypothetical protein
MVASQPNPDNKAVLVEANGLFLSDMLGIGMILQRAFHQGYNLDGRHTTISAVRGTPQTSVIETQNHFYTGGLAIAQPGMPGPPGVVPLVPRYLPDARSLFVGLHYSLSPLPAVPMATRRADPRVGLFSTTVLDFSNDLARTPRKRYIDRWRLEKKDPAAALSEPVKPITFWIDRNVPLAYRDTVKSAILEWNKAFERAGWHNAIAVEQQADDADWSSLEGTRLIAVRWFAIDGPGATAVGPSQSARVPARSCAAPRSFRRTGRASSVRTPATPSRGCRRCRARPAKRCAAMPTTRWRRRSSATSCWPRAACWTRMAPRPNATSRRA